jgi:integrase
VSAHVLRHTAITNVVSLAGYAVAQAFAGHTPEAVTGRYIHAPLAESIEACSPETAWTCSGPALVTLAVISGS